VLEGTTPIDVGSVFNVPTWKRPNVAVNACKLSEVQSVAFPEVERSWLNLQGESSQGLRILLKKLHEEYRRVCFKLAHISGFAAAGGERQQTDSIGEHLHHGCLSEERIKFGFERRFVAPRGLQDENRRSFVHFSRPTAVR